MYSLTTMTSSNTTMDDSNPSICIPRTFSNIGWLQVKTVFEQLFGENTIERVDVARKTTFDGKKFNCVFVHFKAWPNDAYSQEIRQTILDGKTIKIVYDSPWYWKCSLSRLPRPEKRYLSKRPFIISDDCDKSVPKIPSLRRENTVAVRTEDDE